MENQHLTHSQHHHNEHRFKRMLVLFVSIFIGLSSGTPYLYGVYSPQLIQRVGLTASDSATISLAINIGAGTGGLIGGVLIDHRGPRVSVRLGSILIFLGYSGLFYVYQNRISNLAIICVSAILTGFGSITAFFAVLKAAQANYPQHRGTAGVFPVSSYGLAATVFSVIAANFFSSNTGGFLGFLSLSCGITAFIGSFFIGIYRAEDEDDSDDEESAIQANDPQQMAANDLYQLVIEDSPAASAIEIQRSDSSSDQQSLAGSFSFWGIGTRTPRNSVSSVASEVVPLLKSIRDMDKNSSLPQALKRSNFQSGNDTFSSKNSPTVSKNNTPAVSKKNSIENLTAPPPSTLPKQKKSPIVIIKKLLSNKRFLTHYLMVALMSGSCQNYIYSVGFIVAAQMNKSTDNKLTPSQVQAIQVGIISFASFSGRLFSGIFSDFIYKKYHVQRLWIIVFNVILATAGHFITLNNNGNVHLISLTSAMIGGSYGLTFGAYPAIVADFFGTKTFSTTWGLICTGPLVILYSLNKYFGHIYDSHTDKDTGICYDGNECYKGASEACIVLCGFVLIINFILIYIHRRK